MRVIKESTVKAYVAHRPDAEVAMLAWLQLLRRNAIPNFARMREIFGSVDKVGDFHVFDIRGNHYRIVCDVLYGQQIVFIKHILTHAEYDRGHWKR